METAHQRGEVEPLGPDEDELAVEHDAIGLEGADTVDDLREVARQRSIVPAAEVDRPAVAEHEAPEAVPLGLVEVVAPRQLAGQPGEHRLERRFDRKRHAIGLRERGSRTHTHDWPRCRDRMPAADAGTCETQTMSVVLAVVDAPWGPINLAATDAGVVALEALSDPDDFCRRVTTRRGEALAPSRGARPAAEHVARASDAVRTLLDGMAPDVGGLPLDLEGARPFDAAVFAGVRDIPWGRVTSYGRLARRIGRAGAARAVGGAVGRNPIGLLIPCHRVVAGDGSIGGYGGDAWGSRDALLDIKRQLLALERVTIPAPHLLE